jgi:uncharacterized membrane protein YqjE
METPTETVPNLAAATKRLTQRAFVIGENRIELLMLEVQEERERILRSIWLALSAVVFGLLAGITLTALIAAAFWQQSPLTVLAVLTVLYGGAAVGLYFRLSSMQKDWETLPATIDQLKKDRECLEKHMG